MRLWSLHPQYLDARGLVALWREALLAQAVLRGQTQGYTRHPQLERFRQSPAPEALIAAYLQEVHREALRRDYRFDQAKIGPSSPVSPVDVPQGQLEYEWSHLTRKLQQRAPQWLAGLGEVSRPQPHPVFWVVPGGVASWEIIKPDPESR